MTERFIETNGQRLWTETFGSAEDPALLLIMGAGAQAVRWEDDFCKELADHALFVIRYDSRDVGRSTRVDFDKTPYTLHDMAADAVGVLDDYGVASAHVAGASLGGMVAQHLAIFHPERVRSLTSIMSSPVAGTGSDDQALAGGAPTELPGPRADFVERALPLFGPPPADPAERVRRAIEMERLLAGTLGFDLEARRRVAELEEARSAGTDRGANHGKAVTTTVPSDRRPLLRQLVLPTLVIHGTEDPILQLPHGAATAEAIAGSQFLEIEGMGHELPRQLWPTAIGAMTAMIDRCEARAPLCRATTVAP